MTDPASFDIRVKLQIYETIAGTAQAPDAAMVARALGSSPAEVEAAFQALGQKRLLVLEPGSTTSIRMAPPFSGIETPFRVAVQETVYYANCVWDALGIPAALHADGLVQAEDALTGEPLSVEVRRGRVVPQPYAVHFAVPASQWWDDIIYT